MVGVSKNHESSEASFSEWTPQDEKDYVELSVRLPQLKGILDLAEAKQGASVDARIPQMKAVFAAAEGKFEALKKRKVISLLPDFARSIGADPEKLRKTIEEKLKAPDATMITAIKFLAKEHYGAMLQRIEQGQLANPSKVVEEIFEPFRDLLGSEYSFFIPQKDDPIDARSMMDVSIATTGNPGRLQRVYAPGIIQKMGEGNPDKVVSLTVVSSSGSVGIV